MSSCIFMLCSIQLHNGVIPLHPEDEAIPVGEQIRTARSSSPSPWLVCTCLSLVCYVLLYKTHEWHSNRRTRPVCHKSTWEKDFGKVYSIQKNLEIDWEDWEFPVTFSWERGPELANLLPTSRLETDQCSCPGCAIPEFRFLCPHSTAIVWGFTILIPSLNQCWCCPHASNYAELPETCIVSFWPAGAAKVGCQKAENDWSSIRRGSLQVIPLLIK